MKELSTNELLMLLTSLKVVMDKRNIGQLELPMQQLFHKVEGELITRDDLKEALDIQMWMLENKIN